MTAQDRSSKWSAVALLWGVALLNYLDRQVIFAQFPLIQHDLHATSLELGLISSVFLWVYAALSPFAGYLADCWGRARVILLSLLVWSGATWITAHVHSIEQMLFSRMLMGVSEAFYLPAALALIVNRHGPETRSLATGIHQSGLYTGSILGGVWGGWMAQHYGWRPTFTVLGIAGVAYGIVLLFALPKDLPQPAAPVRIFLFCSTSPKRRGLSSWPLLSARSRSPIGSSTPGSPCFWWSAFTCL